MPLIDEINNLKQQGYSEADIIENLQQRGVSPREINDTISRSKVKSAVSTEEDSGQMIPSVMNREENPQEEIPEPGQSQPQYQEQYSQEQYPQEQYEQGYDESYPQEYSQGYETQSYGTEQVSEVADQIVEEKLSKINPKIHELLENKTLISAQVEKIDERLKKIEAIIDQLQMSLIRKANEQQENIEDIKSEMELMQEGLGKIISNPKRKTTRKKK